MTALRRPRTIWEPLEGAVIGELIVMRCIAKMHKQSIVVVVGLLALLPGALYLILQKGFPGRHGGFISIVGEVVFPFVIFSPILAIVSFLATLIAGWWCFRFRSQRSLLALFFCLTAVALYGFVAYDFGRLWQR